MFLQEVIQYLKTANPSWEKMVLILPSNRSIREFKTILSWEIKTPVFSPKFFTIESFIAELSGLSLCDSIELQLRLYEVYQRISPNNKEDYNNFSAWSTNILNDFNEIDRYLIPPKEILDYLSAIASIKNWGSNENPTSLVSEYTKFVKGLNKLYVEFNSSLFENRLAYQGMLYRHAVNNIDAYIQKQESISFQIIGLNALNKAEKSILNKLLDIPKSTIFWDMDSFFLTDKNHSASYFIRQNKSIFKKHAAKQKYFSNNNFLSQKSIQIDAVPKNISQAKQVGQLLKSLSSNAGRSALVLADETLLPAIINSIPQIAHPVNITMGYPIKVSHSYKFLKRILNLNHTTNNNGYYYKDVLRFLSNPISSCLLNQENIESFSKKLKSRNEFFIKKTELQKLLTQNQPLQNCILEKQTVLERLEEFAALFSSLAQKNTLTSKIEHESCYSLVSALTELLEKISGLSHHFLSTDLETLIESQLDGKTISFKGDPNNGLQIMGLLETRALDFDTVIITSVNEGILPAGKSYNSFIPYDVKREFGLPTIKEKDAVYTYHFYRLLQRAKNVHLIYNTEPDVLKGGEPSRFIHQLTTDPSLKASVRHNFYSLKLPSAKNVRKRVEKTGLLIENLKAIAAKGFSPSSLASYIRNPYGFYKQYVLRVDAPESVDEDIAYNVLGSIIHDSLEKLYQPLVGTNLAPLLVEGLESKIETIILSEFEKYYFKKAVFEGKNVLLFQVVKKYIQSVILQDKSTLENNELSIVSLEQKLSIPLKTQQNIPIILKGKLDRVDSLNAQLRIIDYKTGSVENSGLNITSLDELFSNKKYDKAFQLLCYSLLYYEQENKMPEQAFILPIKQMNKGLLPLKVNKSTQLSIELLQEFKHGLINLIEEILNPEIPFVDKED